MSEDMRTTGGPVPHGKVGWETRRGDNGFVPVQNQQGASSSRHHGDDEVDGLPAFHTNPTVRNLKRGPRDDNRSKSDSIIFTQDREFDADSENQDPTWISDDYSESSPLFGSEFQRGQSTMGNPDKPPNDNFRFCWIVFYLLGMTTLLPWNFFISVNDYWNYKFRNTTSGGGGNTNTSYHQLVLNEEGENAEGSESTDLQKQFTSYLAIASNIPNAIFVILNVFFGRAFKLNIRIIGALSCMSTLFIGVILMARINSDAWQEWFLFSTLTIVVLLNICTAIFQGGIIGVAGKFPPNYIGGMMSGQALGGIFPSLVNILVIAIQVKEADIGFYCFIVAFVFVLLSLGLYCAVQTTPFFRYYAGTGGSNNRVEDSSQSAESQNNSVSLATYGEVFKTSWRYQVSVFLNFATTLSVFPSVIVLIQSQYSGDKDNTFAQTYFIPVTCFLLFNVGDYVGRTLASLIKQPNSSVFGQYIILALSVARIAFIPLFLYCNAAPDSRSMPVAFDKDAVYYTLMIVFSISNGYIGNICMMMGPKTVQNDSYQEIVASMLVSILVLGIGLGSAMSYPLVSILS